MLIQPKVRGFICTAAHPQGCFRNVQEQVDYIIQQRPIAGPKNVLIIGASTGFGLAARIVSSLGMGARSIGVSFERPATDKRTASAGWYNTAAFEQYAQTQGVYAKSINGDAFCQRVKEQTAQAIREHLGQIDLLIYSVAAPRRTDPSSGQTFHSVLKPIGSSFTSKTVDPMTGEVKQITLEPATIEEIAATEQVMGGSDWLLWIDFLLSQDLLAPGMQTVAFSYLGPKLTYPIYKEGTIGRAKQHLANTVLKLEEKLLPIRGKALISFNKALVTQASAAIPVVPLYVALLYKVMKEQGLHEGCIEQMYRLFSSKLYPGNKENTLMNAAGIASDPGYLIHLDDLEMRESVQEAVAELWEQVDSTNIETMTDLKGYREEFYRLFGFGIAGVDYTLEVDPRIPISSIPEGQEVVVEM